MLIVEDEPDALEVLVSWMQHQRGWEVRSAQSGRSAVELSKTFKPDVVIADYLLQDQQPVRCILVTGRLAKALQDAQRINGVPILTKPLDFRRLGRLLTEAPS